MFQSCCNSIFRNKMLMSHLSVVCFEGIISKPSILLLHDWAEDQRSNQEYLDVENNRKIRLERLATY